MKRKRILAMLVAATMVIGTSMTALAADQESTITGNGEISYVTTEAFSVTLPTTASMDLTIDPQGLTNLQDGHSASLADLSAEAGKVFGASKPVVINKSSYPVEVRVKLKAETTDTGEGGTTFATALADITDTTEDKKILLYVVPSSTNVVAADAADYTSSTTGYVINATEATVKFVLEGADYVVKNDGGTYSYALAEGADNKGHGTALDFGGVVAKKADWSAYTGGSAKTISVSAVFSVTPDTKSDATVDTASGVYGLESGQTLTSVTVTPPGPVDPSIGTSATFDGTAGTITIPLSLGTGEKATTIKSVYYGTTEAQTLLESSKYTISGSNLVMTLPESFKGHTGDVRLWINLTNGSNSGLILCGR